MSNFSSPKRSEHPLWRPHRRLAVRASDPGVVERPEVREKPPVHLDDAWIVTVYNNNHNTYEEVIAVLMLATGCSAEEAYIEAWEVDHLGQSVVHRASEEPCRDAAQIISKIGIRVEATPEWVA